MKNLGFTSLSLRHVVVTLFTLAVVLLGNGGHAYAWTNYGGYFTDNY